ncbi:MAG: tryptophan 7-halogenase, partial [Kangiellaceae bacterium]|nr:tryptophan 7-halogenase [Kangiellaceae bacterium]
KIPEYPFADAVSPQTALCRNHLAPKPRQEQTSLADTRYAYHLDAGKLGELLKDFCTKTLGVELIRATVSSVKLNENGHIHSVTTEQVGELEADFFVDCTGFRSVLLGGALNVPFIDKNDSLFVDSAIATQVPNQSPSCDIPSNTISTAHEAGWTWDIALAHRRGVGYVYSSRYSDKESAEKLIRNYIGKQSENLEAKYLSFKVGVREQQWSKNCLAIGFSGGFAEPLEATAIAMIESAALTLASDFPHDPDSMPAIRKKFNDTFEYRWQSIFDFIKMHYYLSDRDEPFWIDNRNLGTLSDRLSLLLERWKYYPPNADDFPSAHGMFSVLSWQYVLYGMDYSTNVDNHLRIQRQMPHIEKGFQRVQQLSNQWKSSYPTNRQLLDSINGA